MNIKGITFFYPHYKIGGIQVLFYRLARSLSKRAGLEINIVDYNGGCLWCLTEDLNVNRIAFEYGKSTELPENTVVIFESFLPTRYRSELRIKKNSRVFFWTLHHYNLVPGHFTENNFNIYKKFFVSILAKNEFKKCQYLVNLAVNNKALAFMDSTTLDNTNKYLMSDFKVERYLPVPALNSDLKRERLVSEGEISLGWVGRLVDFKVYILIYTIKRVARYALQSKTKTVFHVVGDGPFFSQVQCCETANEYFSMIMHKEIAPDQLDSFLVQNVDLLTAMGTSALEGAKLGIPAIVVDFAYKKIEGDYMFRWLHHTKEYDLAHEITESDLVAGNTSLENMIEQVLNEFQQVSVLSIQYFNQNHSIDTVAKRFLEMVGESSLYFHQIDKRILNLPLYMKVYRLVKRINSIIFPDRPK